LYNLSFPVFLAVISNHTVPTTPLQQKVFSNGSSTLHVHQEKQPSQGRIPSTNGKDLLTKYNISISMEVFAACILLTPTIYYCVMIFIHEGNHLCSCPGWICSRRSSSKGISAASNPADHQSATLESVAAQLPEDTKEKSVPCYA
ncbi:hypothetical protein ASZ78_009749, partial [Callipepla squamata]